MKRVPAKREGDGRTLAAVLLLAAGVALIPLSVAYPPEMGGIFGEDEIDFTSSVLLAAVHIAIAAALVLPIRLSLLRLASWLGATLATTGLLLWGSYAVGSILYDQGWRLVISILIASAYLLAVVFSIQGIWRGSAASGRHSSPNS